MISVSEATRIIQKTARAFGTDDVPVAQATGRILQEDLRADRDFPPFDRVTMDGIALCYQAWESGRRNYPVESVAAAGKPQVTLADRSHCIEVMTGAILPAGCDTVIRYEDLDLQNDVAKTQVDPIHKGQNIHFKGEDRRSGDLIVPAGRRLTAAELSVAATVGKDRLKVSGLPRTCIITSGDELVPVDTAPLPHQIRHSNAHTIASLLSRVYIEADHVHVRDDTAEISRVLDSCMRKFDVLILSGGISKGKFDYIPLVLEQAGVHKHFHKVAQRPGKPFWFGESDRGHVVFALPGNPVSAFVCALRYVLPWVESSLGCQEEGTYAVLDSDVTFKPDLTYFLPVRLTSTDDGIHHAVPVTGHGSGDLANLVDADGFLELSQGRDVYEQGMGYRVWGYR